ncbi:hypothetical protein SO802_028328 [Lithocarpus litseifolius]|uniref:Uncharacterized protein n=1 Tax=Lithocarpus litseifolius TaxID=425828 RepID=A0AAW2BQ13_9ROSI
MEPHYLVPQALLWTRWAIRHMNQVIPIPEKIIAQIRASPTDTLGWFEEDLKAAWKNFFPITQASLRGGDLALEHPTWGLTPNQWWKFHSDIPLITEKNAEALNKQRRPLVVPHLDELGWLV